MKRLAFVLALMLLLCGCVKTPPPATTAPPLPTETTAPHETTEPLQTTSPALSDPFADWYILLDYTYPQTNWLRNAMGCVFETPAEIRAVRILGADAVGMSTVTEALTAAHCGMPLMCLSVMTNMAAGVLNRPLTNDEVDETAKTIATRFSAYVTKIVSRMDEVEL